MNKWLRKRKARGFTLVELLIVIVIIGILAGSMLLVFGSATDKARASKVVSNLRSLKAAALMCYADFDAWPTTIASLEPYMDRTVLTEASADGQTYYSVGDSPDVYVGAHLQGDDARGGVQNRLADTAQESGLYSNQPCTTTYGSGTDVYVKLSN